MSMHVRVPDLSTAAVNNFGGSMERAAKPEEDKEHALRARKMLREKREKPEPLTFDNHVERQMKLFSAIKERLIKDGLYE